jgi:hypothetical protein
MDEQRHVRADYRAVEEFRHFGMDLEFLLREKPNWRSSLQNILSQPGNIVELGEPGEEAEDGAG